MEKFADFMALGIHANERLERRAEKAAMTASTPAPAAVPSPVDSTGTFGRRFSKRYAGETRLYEERRGKGKQSCFSKGNLGGIAELEGDGVQGFSELSAAEACMETAKKAMRPEMGTSDGADGGEVMAMEKWDPSVSPLENVTNKTRMHLLGTVDPSEAEKAARKKQRANRVGSDPLPNTTTETRMLMVGLISPEEVIALGPMQQDRRQSKFHEQGLSPGNRRIDDYSREESVEPTIPEKAGRYKKSRALVIRAPSIKLSFPVKRLSPRKTMSIPAGTRGVSINGTDFDLVQPVENGKTRARPLAIPPRGTSRNFSLPLPSIQEAPQAFGLPPSTVTYDRVVNFMSLPFKVRIMIYNPAVLANHDVFVCQCGLCAWSSSKQPALALVTRQIRAEVLPIYYGENRFIVREEVDWRTSAPIFLRALTPSSRNLIKHVEISTNDLTSAICMMASLGFSLSHLLPSRERVELLREVQGFVVWMTFTAISRKVQAYERLPEIKKVPAITLFDDEPRPLGMQVDGTAETETDDAASTSSAGSVCTAIMNPATYDGIIGQGIAARRVRGRVVTLNSSDGGDEERVEPRRVSGGTASIIFHPSELDLESDVELMEREGVVARRRR
ncbi:hypothetical protein B0A55_04323 [Friedmanniomyces simplex]|uniref:Uncharacterized protein n=1 Tax=Friedmanniomyces simplex TaxID=329884 RepID=A0A4U0XHL9_9PEZI|nr:hypothetical protein B0A55_04323 [Friedmanniomyces simplex]